MHDCIPLYSVVFSPLFKNKEITEEFICPSEYKISDIPVVPFKSVGPSPSNPSILAYSNPELIIRDTNEIFVPRSKLLPIVTRSSYKCPDHNDPSVYYIFVTSPDTLVLSFTNVSDKLGLYFFVEFKHSSQPSSSTRMNYLRLTELPMSMYTLNS